MSLSKFKLTGAFKIPLQSVVTTIFCPSNKKDYLSVFSRPFVVRERCDGKKIKKKLPIIIMFLMCGTVVP